MNIRRRLFKAILLLVAGLALLALDAAAQSDPGGFRVVHVAPTLGPVDVFLRADAGGPWIRHAAGVVPGSTTESFTIPGNNYMMRLAHAGVDDTITVVGADVIAHRDNTFVVYSAAMITKLSPSTPFGCWRPDTACVSALGDGTDALTLTDPLGGTVALTPARRDMISDGVPVHAGRFALSGDTQRTAVATQKRDYVIVVNGSLAWLWHYSGGASTFQTFAPPPGGSVAPRVRIANLADVVLDDVRVDGASLGSPVSRMGLSRVLNVTPGIRRVVIDVARARRDNASSDAPVAAAPSIDTFVAMAAGEMITILVRSTVANGIAIDVARTLRDSVAPDGAHLFVPVIDSSARGVTVFLKTSGTSTQIARSTRAFGTVLFTLASRQAVAHVAPAGRAVHGYRVPMTSDRATLIVDVRPPVPTAFLLDDEDLSARTLSPLEPTEVPTSDRLRFVNLVRGDGMVALTLNDEPVDPPLRFLDVSPTRPWSSIVYRLAGRIDDDTVLSSRQEIYDDVQHTHLATATPAGVVLTGLVADELSRLDPPPDSALVRLVLAVADSSRPYRSFIARPTAAPATGSLTAVFGRTAWVPVAANSAFTVGVAAINGSVPPDSVTLSLPPGTASTVYVLRHAETGLLEFYLLGDSSGAVASRLRRLVTGSAVREPRADVAIPSISWTGGLLRVSSPAALPSGTRLRLVDARGRLVVDTTPQLPMSLPDDLASGVYRAVLIAPGGSVLAALVLPLVR